MKNRFAPIFAFLLLFSPIGWGEQVQPTQKHKLATDIITDVIHRYHYKKVTLNNKLSAEIWQRYLDSLDPNRNIFLHSDIEELSKYKFKIDDSLLQSDLDPAYAVFLIYKKRLANRVKFAISLLDLKHDFSIDEEYEFDRNDKPWPKTTAAYDDIWNKRVKNDILSLRISGKKPEEIKTTLKKRYQRLIRNIEQWQNEDIYQIYINAYTQSIEPHTAYFSPRTSENFKINMSLSLEGIGAALRSENEYTIIQRVIKGGPADISGQLHSEDKIIGVGQGKQGKIQDVVGFRLSDVVDLIRGPKDSIVRLQILKKGIDQGTGKIVTLVRNKIKLEEQAAKSSVIEIDHNRKKLRIGVLDVPTFYMDFDARARGDSNFRSTTRDVQRLITKLKKQNIDGIIVDLRGNGGGSLVEATSLTGLFIKSGPVVQVKSADGEIKVNKDPSPGLIYAGPLAVLVDRYSASASEIFAGAIQDYRRGIIIGEPTFGKGTVQTLIDLNHFVKRSIGVLGQLKITMAQFFRINGESTQFRGVVPDIIFPTNLKTEKLGERGLDNALPWSRIKSAKFNLSRLLPNALAFSKKRYIERLKMNSPYQIIKKEAKRHMNILNKTSISLMETKRIKEKEELEKNRDKNDRQFKIALGLDPDAKKKDIKKNEKKKSATEADNEDNAVSKFLLKEAAQVLSDYINFAKHRIIVHNKIINNNLQ